MNQKIADRIKAILARELNFDINKITFESSLIGDLGADSLDIAEISLIVKDEFQYEMTDVEMQQIRTVGDLCGLLNQATAKGSS